ncbi:hypothetical protein JMJ56_13610 [Belnapia sp. T18]|uniref:Short chain dehydrogenase n=1 Tax=Belnapia arida TaxID=2804533 RepID=A0ABS1U3B6_9PROT|nr:hypothetical protein [Belnapia arida]MBL6079050.1 hypothetical protein [Belnapia arida]
MPETRTILVTGASSGIGRATALAFARCATAPEAMAPSARPGPVSR